MESNIHKAICSIETLQRQLGKRHSRVHNEGAEDNVNRLRALNGICGGCIHIKVEAVHIDGRDRISMRCKASLSPIDLYRNTPLGKEANCPKFVSIQDIQTRP